MALRQRRTLTVAAAILAAVALAVGGGLLTQRDDDRTATAGPPPGEQPGGEGVLADARPRPARPLTWAEGRTIHLGTRTIDAGRDFLSLDVTDDGVAFTTLDGSLWFTDGSTITQIGVTSQGRAGAHGIRWGPAGRPEEWIVSGNAGSRLAWLEYPEFDRPEIVVYDTGEGRRVARWPIDPKPDCEPCARVISVHDDHVYWTDSLWPPLATYHPPQTWPDLFRYELSTGTRTTVPGQSYQAGLRAMPRTLVIGDSVRSGTVTDGVNQGFTFVGSTLRARGRGTPAVFDAVAGTQLRLRPPPGSGYGHGSAERLHLFQWLDDDRFALLDATPWNAGDYGGEDLLVCRISSGRCVVAVPRPAAAGSPIVPEVGTPGDEIALARAAGRISGR